MYPKWKFIILIGFLCTNCNSDDPEPVNPEIDILDRLGEIEGINVTELPTVDHFNRLFEIQFTQPIDHDNPSGDRFTQKIFLGHIDEDLPIVFETEGYASSEHRTRELSDLLRYNQLAVEHRYFGESVPGNRDWQYLNIEQAANDHHRIVEAFKTIYTSSWISSGASKGGDAAIFHRRFYPNDVDATLAYVAPILFEQQDKRFLDFYATSGDDSCRNKMKSFQRSILIKIDSMPALFDTYVKSVGDFGTATTFTLPYRDIVYHAIREDYAFEFWSSETENCNTIPTENASAQELFDHFRNVFDVFLFFSDYGIAFWTPYTYQALTEMGNYAYDVSYLDDLEMPVPPLGTFDTNTDFDPSVMQDIQNWITASASEMIFIYGADDPWTVGAVQHEGSQSVIKIINPNTKHGTRITSLSQTDQDLVINALTNWIEN